MKKKFDFNFNRNKDEAKGFERKTSSKDFRPRMANSRNDNLEEGKPTVTIYVANLNYRRDEDGIKELFAPYGYVKSVKIVYKEDKTKKTGIAFVQMTNEEKAIRAISELNGKIIDERTLKVSIANDRFKNS
jgi:RNA recognition motif-containing protein